MTYFLSSFPDYFGQLDYKFIQGKGKGVPVFNFL